MRIHLGFTDADLANVPGDLYGPRARLVFRVDQEVADHVQGLCETLAAAPLAPPLDQPMLVLSARAMRGHKPNVPGMMP